MITTVQGLRSKINEERKSKAAQQGKQPELVPQCEHLWVVSGVSFSFLLLLNDATLTTGHDAACARTSC